jgi:hypothetical protein
MDDDAEIDETYAQNIIQEVLANHSGNDSNSAFELNQNSEEEPLVDLQEIIGLFDTDEHGNLVIIRKAGSNQLLDKLGRRVNRRGYLIDDQGNVVD